VDELCNLSRRASDSGRNLRDRNTARTFGSDDETQARFGVGGETPHGAPVDGREWSPSRAWIHDDSTSCSAEWRWKPKNESITTAQDERRIGCDARELRSGALRSAGERDSRADIAGSGVQAPLGSRGKRIRQCGIDRHNCFER
jgi:hypothetical protein